MLISLVIFVVLCNCVQPRMQDYTLDVNDILNDQLMPMSLMLLESKSKLKNVSIKSLDDEFQCATKDAIKDDGSLFNAINSMGFHRKMINEFLSCKFLNEKIIEEIRPKQMKNRLGVAKITSKMANNSLALNDDAGKSMLFDQGSYEYKNWLTKAATLNDIHRNIKNANGEERKLRRQDQFIDDNIDYKYDLNEYDEGDVTGYMMQKPITTNGGANSFNNYHMQDPDATAGAKTEKADDSPVSYSTFQDLQNLSNGYIYGPTAQQDYSYGNYAQQHPMWSGNSGGSSMKSIGLKDLFDIALTTLAFLSFGMFIIQVLMCITMAKSDSNSVMLPMEMTADGAEVEAAELEVRVKRAIEEFPDNNIKQANIISKRALQSIEAFIMAKDDHGQCLRKYICENNKYSREVMDIQKYMIPVFGLGLSWMSNKLNNMPFKSNLENLQASLIGLGNGNCTIFKCDTQVLINSRKR